MSLSKRLAQLAVAQLFLGTTIPSEAATPRRNILWNSSFECGVGSGSWGVLRRVGPNVPELRHPAGWHGSHSLSLVKPVGSRLYRLGDKPGVWRLSLMAKRVGGDGKLAVVLTNRNHYSQKREGVNAYREEFTVGETWQSVSLDAGVGSVHRPYFHIELSGSGVRVDGVMLYRLAEPGEQPIAYHAIQDVETGFIIPEITRTYVGDGKRPSYLVAVNNGALPIATTVSYTIFDVHEQPVETQVVDVRFGATETKQIPVPLDGLKYSAYRLRSAWQDAKQQGDGLVAILPEARRDCDTRWGCNASLGPESLDFSIRMMKRLGMSLVNTVSTGAFLGRWYLVESAEGVYGFQPAVVRKLKDNNIAVNVYMGAGRGWPRWLTQKHGEDEDPIIKAYGRYVYNLVKAYAPYTRHFTLEDETERALVTPNGWHIDLQGLTATDSAILAQ